MVKTGTLIIGAGPYGLSLANYLAHQGKDFRICGKIMELWRNHTFPAMDLRSDIATSTIKHPENRYSFEHFCAAADFSLDQLQGQLPVETFRHYVDWVQAQLPYPVQEQYVTRVERDGHGYRSVLEDGTVVTSRQVVVASGIAHHLRYPALPEPHPPLIHSYHTRRIEDLHYRKVLVIGAGQSAAESIETLLANTNLVDWYSRKPPVYYQEPLNLPEWLFQLVVRSSGLLRRIPPGVHQRVFQIFSATTITPDFQEKLRTVPHYRVLPSLGQYDHIVTATGYRYNLSVMRFLAPGLLRDLRMRNDMPHIDHRFESSLPGLFFLGAITEQFFGPPMKFMIGSHYAAPTVASVLR